MPRAVRVGRGKPLEVRALAQLGSSHLVSVDSARGNAERLRTAAGK